MDDSSSEIQRYYQIVLVSMRDPIKFATYLELMAPIVRRYGGGLERMLAPEQMLAEALTKPDTINVVFYDSRDAFAAFNRDPDFQKIAHLRAESIAMASIGGLPLAAAPPRGSPKGSLYVLEVARYASSGAAGYQAYERQAAPIMRHYGYSVERTLVPDAVSEFPFIPDIVKVAYFDTPDGLRELQSDPAHQRIERELYPAAVAESVYVFARVHPSSLAADV